MAQDNDMGDNPWHFDTDCTVDGAELRPFDDCMRPENTTERVAIMVYRLSQGDAMTTAEAANLAGMSRRGAADMLDRVSRVVPIYKDEGRWRKVELDPE